MNNTATLHNIADSQAASAPVSSGMEKLCIIGGNQLNGTIPISGAKNAALKMMCAALLAKNTLHLDNMPLAHRAI